MSDQQKYIGITLGPIGRTLAKADKTREFWGASYLFSYLSRRIIESLLQAGFTTDEIVNPSPAGLRLSDKPGVGLYSDQIFLQSKNADAFQKVQDVIVQCKKELAQQIITSIRTYKGYDLYANLFKHRILDTREKDLMEYLFNYFQVYSVEIPEDEDCLNLKDKNGNLLSWFGVLKRYLEHLEMRAGVAHFDPDPIKVFLRGINHSFLRKDAFRRRYFDSFYGISTVDLRYVQEARFREHYDHLFDQELDEAISSEAAAVVDERILKSLNDEAYAEHIFKEEQVEEEGMLDQIAKIPGIQPELRGYHRYIAIIHADIDRLGSFIGQLAPAQMQEFTALLIQFSKEVNALIAGKKYTHDDSTDWGFGAAPVYIGGDDLVFFAPVAVRDLLQPGKNASIFHLIQQIDETFHSILNEQDEGGYKFLPEKLAKERPSLSFGLTISYVKYPLQEAYERSYDLLEEVKGDPDSERNLITFELRKHSGQVIRATISKEQNRGFADFLSLIEEYGFKTAEADRDEAFLNSLTHGLEWYTSALLSYTGCDLKQALEAFFAQNFNEPIHQQETYQKYLVQIRTYLLKLLNSASKNQFLSREAQFKNLYGALRFIHFIREHDYE